MIRYFLLTMVLLSTSACTLVDNTETIYGMTEEDVNQEIRRLEAKPIYDYTKLGEMYAFRSTFYAYHKPYYKETRCFKTPGLILFGPLFICGETLKLPYDWYKTLTVSEQDIEKALEDLDKARSYNYTQEHTGFQMLIWGKYMDTAK